MQANIANPPYTIDSDIEKGTSSARVTFKNDAKDSDSLFAAIMYKLAFYPSTVVQFLLPVDDFSSSDNLSLETSGSFHWTKPRFRQG